MWSIFLLTFVLGLLSHHTVADYSVDYAFSLHTPDERAVILVKDQITLVKSSTRASYFALTDGKLTTADGSRSAILGPVPPIFPPVLLPIFFAEGSSRAAYFSAVSTIDPDGNPALKLVSEYGRKLK